MVSNSRSSAQFQVSVERVASGLLPRGSVWICRAGVGTVDCDVVEVVTVVGFNCRCCCRGGAGLEGDGPRMRCSSQKRPSDTLTSRSTAHAASFMLEF